MENYYNEHVTQKHKFIDLEKHGIDIHRVIYDLTVNSSVGYEDDHIIEYLFFYCRKHKILPRTITEFKNGYYNLPEIPEDYDPENLNGLRSYRREHLSFSQNLSYKRDFYYEIGNDTFLNIVDIYLSKGRFEDTLSIDIPYVVQFMIYLSFLRKDGYFYDKYMELVEGSMI